LSSAIQFSEINQAISNIGSGLRPVKAQKSRRESNRLASPAAGESSVTHRLSPKPNDTRAHAYVKTPRQKNWRTTHHQRNPERSLSV